MFVLQDTGAFNQKPEQKSAQDQLMNNPDVMTDMMKKNLGGIVPQVCIRLLRQLVLDCHYLTTTLQCPAPGPLFGVVFVSVG